MAELYCQVVNGEPEKGPCPLPKNGKNISNLPALSDAELVGSGWYPVEESRPDFNPKIQTCVGPALTVEADKVTAVWTVADRPLAVVKADLIDRLKRETSAAILAVAPDYAQRNAALGIGSATEIEAIKSAIVAHRDACNAKEEAIAEAATIAEALAVLA